MVVHFLAEQVGRQNILSVQNDKDRKSFINHSDSTINRYNWIVGHLPLWEFEKVIKDVSTWNIFTILRDPYQRFISQYKYLYYSDHPDHKKYKSMDFEEYIEVYKATMPNFMCSMFSKVRTPNNAVDEIKKHNVAVYYLDRLEQLEADLSLVTDNEIKFDKVINKSKPVDIDFEKHRIHIEDIVAQDRELYEACQRTILRRLIS